MPEKRERKKRGLVRGGEGLCGDGGVGGRSILSSRNICLTKCGEQM